MSMKSLKTTKPESNDDDDATDCQPGRAAYPYGTRITLDADSIKKLGIQKMPAVGSKVKFEAEATVALVSQSEDGKRIELQVTGMDMGAAGSKEGGELARADSGPMAKLAKSIKGL